MRSLIRLTAAAGALFVALSVWPAQAADRLGVVPQVELAHAAEVRDHADHVVIMMPDAAVALPGVVVVEE
jgi:hypothetical protein